MLSNLCLLVINSYCLSIETTLCLLVINSLCLNLDILKVIDSEDQLYSRISEIKCELQLKNCNLCVQVLKLVLFIGSSTETRFYLHEF